MSQSHTSFFGYWLYYDDDNYSSQKGAFSYLNKLDESQIKTFFDAAKMSGEANFKGSYGTNYKIVYDYSSKVYTLVSG
jgi:hypothetical protein